MCRRNRRKIALQGLYLKNKNFLEIFDIPTGHPSLVARPNSSFKNHYVSTSSVKKKKVLKKIFRWSKNIFISVNVYFTLKNIIFSKKIYLLLSKNLFDIEDSKCMTVFLGDRGPLSPHLPPSHDPLTPGEGG